MHGRAKLSERSRNQVFQEKSLLVEPFNEAITDWLQLGAMQHAAPVTLFCILQSFLLVMASRQRKRAAKEISASDDEFEVCSPVARLRGRCLHAAATQDVPEELLDDGDEPQEAVLQSLLGALEGAGQAEGGGLGRDFSRLPLKRGHEARCVGLAQPVRLRSSA